MAWRDGSGTDEIAGTTGVMVVADFGGIRAGHAGISSVLWKRRTQSILKSLEGRYVAGRYGSDAVCAASGMFVADEAIVTAIQKVECYFDGRLSGSKLRSSLLG